MCLLMLNLLFCRLFSMPIKTREMFARAQTSEDLFSVAISHTYWIIIVWQLFHCIFPALVWLLLASTRWNQTRTNAAGVDLQLAQVRLGVETRNAIWPWKQSRKCDSESSFGSNPQPEQSSSQSRFNKTAIKTPWNEIIKLRSKQKADATKSTRENRPIEGANLQQQLNEKSL